MGGEELVELIFTVPYAFISLTETISNLHFFCIVEMRGTYWSDGAEWTEWFTEHDGVERASWKTSCT